MTGRFVEALGESVVKRAIAVRGRLLASQDLPTLDRRARVPVPTSRVGPHPPLAVGGQSVKRSRRELEAHIYITHAPGGGREM